MLRAAGVPLLLGLLSCGGGRDVDPEETGPAQSVSLPTAGLGAGAASHEELASRGRTLRRGALIDASTGRGLSSRTANPGETLKATVYADALDDIGRIVIPTGSMVELMVTDVTPPGNRNGNDATITLVITGLLVRGRHYAMPAELKSMYHSLEGRQFPVGERTEARASPYGIVAGRVIGGDELGTIVGGAMRRVGDVVAVFQPAGRDVVVLTGTPIVIKLTDAFTLQWR